MFTEIHEKIDKLESEIFKQIEEKAKEEEEQIEPNEIEDNNVTKRYDQIVILCNYEGIHNLHKLLSFLGSLSFSYVAGKYIYAYLQSVPR